ncbi:hypothetical protein N7495_009155 [Penicillium taxi]|uniref:uncharacterized protein n=1 Tax=Penicillium taxi TaxID=168475 RepID=UPI002544DF4D|nr:uncharacterized protein N7495_009155 [Penicillium taxi]KAJ5884645.1 hypothetical protein N7495_009155 [Penicillium taxi]
MARVLLTGGSGFIAAHILQALLERGHFVVTTVRSAAKGDKILAAYPNTPQEKLSYVIVEDIAADGAFDEAVKYDPPFEFVIHTASPFHHKFADPLDLLNPAVNGTKGILKAIKAHAPSVKRVVVYDETSWNPVTWDEAIAERSKTYRGSKKFAEKAAWDFIEKENPGFDLATINPPLVYGPVVHHLEGLSRLNTSNQTIGEFVQGKHTADELPPTGTLLWVDVRDLALAHVKAIEIPEAGGNRFFVTAGYCSTKRIVDAIRQRLPELAASRLPKNPIEDFPKTVYGYDNSKTRNILGINFRSLEDSIGDTAVSLLQLAN